MIKQLLIAALLISVSFIGGYYSKTIALTSSLESGLSKIVSSNPEISFDACEQLPIELHRDCSDNVFLANSIRESDITGCARIESLGTRLSCEDTINQLLSLEADMQSLCSGHANTDTCIELVKVIQATGSGDLSHCNEITSGDLKRFCSLYIRPETTLLGAGPTGNATTGIVCDSNDQVCAADRVKAINAIQSNEIEGCASAILVTDQCLVEFAAYTLFTSDDIQLCNDQPEDLVLGANGIPEPEYLKFRCQIELTGNKAFLSGDITLCEGLIDEPLIQACKQYAESATEGRFDYLNSI
jgi:hypothetical protein